MTDPITDMLNRLENGQAVNKKTVDIPFSKTKYRIAKVLEAEGFIESAAKKGRNPKKVIRVNLKYEDNEPGITNMERVSKPGRRVYTSLKDIRPVRGGYGISIISTPKGVMSNKEAKSAGLGGEILCKVY
ncbi:MAG: 30S ribosomal protein S8 [Patescibacteria group bacterium]